MIQIEKKISMNESDGSVKALTGLYLIRIATKIPMPVEVARMAVINHLRGEIESRYPENMVTGTGARAKKEALLADLEVLSRIPVVFHTKENYSYTLYLLYHFFSYYLLQSFSFGLNYFHSTIPPHFLK